MLGGVLNLSLDSLRGLLGLYIWFTWILFLVYSDGSSILLGVPVILALDDRLLGQRMWKMHVMETSEEKL